MASGLVISNPVLLENYDFDSFSSLDHSNVQNNNNTIIGELLDTASSTLRKRKKSRSQKQQPSPLLVRHKNTPTEYTASSKRSTAIGRKSYRLSTQPKPKRNSAQHRKSLGDYQTNEQLDQIFQLKPDTGSEPNPYEYPVFMIEYFVKTMDLMKKNPKLEYQILKAKNMDDELPKLMDLVKERKHQSVPLPVQDAKNDLQGINKSKRKSAPAAAGFDYQPIEMSMDEYLRAPLDIYQHRKRKSQASELTFNTKSSSNGHHSTRSGVSSIDTSGLININRLGSERILKTSRKDSLVNKSSIPEEKLELSIEKFGVPTKNISQKHKSFEVKQAKRLSHTADISIESGRDVYNSFKNEVFGMQFKDWKSMKSFIKRDYPDYYYNEYLMTRLCMEIYLRRIIAGRVALKLGTDESNLSDEVIISLKEIITSVYGGGINQPKQLYL